MGKKGFFVTLLLILVLIFFTFPVATGKEYFLLPEKIVDLQHFSSNELVDQSGNVSFLLDNHFGYFTDNMDISFLGKKDYRVSLSDQAFVNHSQIPDILDIQDMNGEGRSIIDATEDSVPVLDGERVVLLSNNFVSFYNLDGNLIWKREILSFVSSLSLTNSMVFLGYVDGSCELIDRSGNEVFEYSPGGSRVEAIYSVALSKDSKYLAVISGLDPQRFILLQNKKDEYKPVYHIELDKQYRRSIDMYFSGDNTMVFFENYDGVNVFDIESKSLLSIGGAGRLQKIYKDEANGLFSLMISDKISGDLKILTPDNSVFLEKRFYGNKYYFKKKDFRYYVGYDDFLMFLKLVRK